MINTRSQQVTAMRNVVQPLEQLRRSIRQSGKSVKSENKNLLMDPGEAFAYAYDAGVVEQALNEFEQEVSRSDELVNVHDTYRKLVKEAQMIAATSEDIDVRDFARSVAAFLVINHSTPTPGNPLRIVASLDEINPL
jgi:hypothetical protein